MNGRRTRRPKGSCSVYHDAARDRWIVALALPPQQKDGRTIRRRRRWTFATKAAANEKAKAVALALDRLRRDAGRQTLASYLRRWLQVTAPELLKPRTITSYTQTIEDYIVPILGTVTMEALSVPHLRQWQHRLRTDKVSAHLRHYAHTVLRSALKHAVIDETIDRNPAADLPVPKARGRKGRALTAPELARLVAAWGDDPIGPLVRVAFGLGLREGEVLALRTDDVLDMPDGRVMRIDRQVQRAEKGLPLQLVSLKSEESHRTVPVHADVEAALELQAARVAQLRREAGPFWQEQGLLFPSAVGTPQDPRNLIRAWHRLRKTAQLGTLRFHDLRHAYATALKQQGADLATIKELLGHSSISVTDGFYGHVVPVLHRSAATSIERVVAGAKVTRTGEPAGSQSAAETRSAPQTPAK